MSTRPVALAVLPANIPDVLKHETRWCVWRYELPKKDSDRWSKIPYIPDSGHAKSNDPRTWRAFDHAVAVYTRCTFDGIGFMLGDGWGALDLDHCARFGDPDYNVNQHEAFHHLVKLGEAGVYVEASPSGTGYKAIGRSSRIGGEIKFDGDNPPVTTSWQGGRFVCVTGQESYGDPTIDITPLLDE